MTDLRHRISPERTPEQNPWFHIPITAVVIFMVALAIGGIA